MARDGSGNYSLPSGNPVTTGTTVSSTTHNSTMTDVANAITASIAKDGQTTPTANLPMGTYRHTGVSSGTARDQYASIGQLQDGGIHYVGSVAGANTITGSLTPAISAYAAGMTVIITPVNPNTSSVTLALNGLAAKAVINPDGNQLLVADLRADVPAILVYDGTQFRLCSTAPLYGTFTATLTGMAGSVTGSAVYARNGRLVTLALPAMSGTSNSTAMAVTGLPLIAVPSFDQWVWGGMGLNNGAQISQGMDALVKNDGTISLAIGGTGSGTSWTNSGTKGISGTSTLTYLA